MVTTWAEYRPSIAKSNGATTTGTLISDFIFLPTNSSSPGSRLLTRARRDLDYRSSIESRSLDYGLDGAGGYLDRSERSVTG